MSLSPGTRLGHYDVTALIGEGGMGRVYQATDTQLNRQVALKILPDVFADDPDRLARFQREAQVLASLNHPGIASIYGIEKSDDTQALVLELVEGPTLADRIAKGPIPIGEALPIATQIAEALEAAHEAGVIHRDLKPANIKVRNDGTVKVLDFGLAKALDAAPQGDPDQSPTLTAAATQMGVIMGTAAYMSPEQTRGKAVDKRTDIWSFGCVLFEMLTGRRAFRGDDVAQTLAKVVEREPNWELLPTGLTRIVDTFIRRCFDKDLRNRVRDIGDARLALAGAFDVGEAHRAATTGRPPGWQVAAAALGIAAIAAASGWALRTPSAPGPARVSRSVLSVPPSGPIDISSGTGDIAIARDGRSVVYPSNGTLHVRYLDRLASVALGSPATAQGPFLSPDGAWVGYATQTLLLRQSIQGGPPETITDTNVPFGGASWGDDDTIVYALRDVGLFQVPAAGGEPEQLTVADGVVHAWPDILPGGRGVLFTIVTDAGTQIALLDLAARTYEVVAPNGAYPRYSATGHILYTSDGALHAVPFDVDARRVTGAPVVVVAEVLTKVQGAASFDVADGGALVYATGGQVIPANLSTPVWVDRNGEETPLPLPTARYFSPRLSPDGRRLAVNVGGSGLWVYDVETGAGFLLVAAGVAPIWTPDGDRIVFASFAGVIPNVYWIATDGTDGAEPLVISDASDVPTGITPDGRTVVFAQIAGDRREVWKVALDSSRTVRPVLQGNVARGNADVSPDGRWLAYRSNRSGAYEVLLQPYPGPGPTVPVSVGGGDLVTWSADSSEMFYRIEDRIMSVQLSPSGKVGRPSLLFAGNYLSTPQNIRQYHVAPDGRFLMLKPSPGAGAATASSQVVHVQNWIDALDVPDATP